MFEMIRRIFKIAGRSRKKIIVGITFNILKSFFNGFMMFGVFWILLHLENLTPTIILQAFGVVLGSVIGRFFFQWMYDRTMSGTGSYGLLFRAKFRNYSDNTYYDDC